MIKSSQILFQPLWENRHAFYELARTHGGLEIVSFAFPSVLNNQAVFDEHLSAYQEELPHISCRKTLHGAFIDVTPHSPDSEVVQVANKRVRESMEVATKLSCSHVIFHTGINTLIRHPDYYSRVTESQSKFWSDVLVDYPNVSICLENMWERKTDVLRNIVERTNDSRLRVCWDCGHSNVFGELTPSEWIQRLAGVTPYAHWNDNFGDRDSELPLGEGNIDWGEIVQLSSQLSEPQLVVLEVGLIDNVKRSLDFLSQNGLLMAG